MSEQPIPTDAGVEMDRMVYLRLFGPISSEARWLGWYHDGGNGRYSSNIAHAWEVVEKLRKAGRSLVMNDTGCQWRLRFLTVEGPRIWDWATNPNDGMTVWSESLPLAICLAAIRALEPTP